MRPQKEIWQEEYTKQETFTCKYGFYFTDVIKKSKIEDNRVLLEKEI